MSQLWCQSAIWISLSFSCKIHCKINMDLAHCFCLSLTISCGICHISIFLIIREIMEILSIPYLHTPHHSWFSILSFSFLSPPPNHSDSQILFLSSCCLYLCQPVYSPTAHNSPSLPKASLLQGGIHFDDYCTHT